MSIALVGRKEAGSYSNRSSSGALYIQPEGIGHVPLLMALDKRDFRPVSVRHGLPSSVIMMFICRNEGQTHSSEKTGAYRNDVAMDFSRSVDVCHSASDLLYLGIK